MTLNIITFASCVLLLLVFRMLDRSNLRMAKLKRYSSKMFDDFKKLADSESRKFNDATIEMDIMIKKSSNLAKSLVSTLKEIEDRMISLEAEKEKLRKIDDDVKLISAASKDVNKQIEFIADARKDFSDMGKKISSMSDNISRIKNDSNAVMQDFADRLRERSREITEDFYSQINSMRESVAETEDKIINEIERKIVESTNNYTQSILDMEKRTSDTGNAIIDNLTSRVEGVAKSVEGAQNLSYQINSLKTTVSDLESTVFADIKEKSNSLKAEINRSITEFDEIKDSIFGNINSEVEKVNNRLKNVEANIDESKSKLIKTFETEVDKVRTELDNLSIHAISKKDEIIQSARKEAEKLSGIIDEFDDKYSKMENRLIFAAEEKLDSINSEYHSIEIRFNNLTEKLNSYETRVDVLVNSQNDKIKKEFSELERRLSEMKNEIMGYEEKNKIFSRSDAMTQKVEESVIVLSRMLTESKEEAKNLGKFFDDIEHIKDIRKNVEKEIRAYQAKKEKLADVEAEIKGLMELSDVAMSRSDLLEQNISKIDNVNNRIEMLGSAYSNLETRINELHEYEDVITKNLSNASKTDIIVRTIETKVTDFQRTIEKSDKRIEKLIQRLHDVEENSLVLKSREREINSIMDKFSEMDNLHTHVEARITQIQAMFNKVETLRKDIDETDTRLQEMFHETDSKMRQLAEFVQAVDKNNPIIKQVKADASITKNLNDNMIKTVRELSRKGWSADEISRKMMVDENSVRFIINTNSL